MEAPGAATKKDKWPWIAGGGGTVLLLLAVIGSGEQPPADAVRSAEPAPLAIAAATPPVPVPTPVTIEEATPQEKLPAFAPPAPLTGFCIVDGCEVQRKTFARRDWPKAWQGDYQGQRNAAFCRGHGCDGAVELNPVEACAWRVIILQAHVDESDQTDTSNFNIDCGKLDAPAQLIARQKAESIHERIYKAPLSKGGVLQ